MAAERDIDEILASIRRIVTDEVTPVPPLRGAPEPQAAEPAVLTLTDPLGPEPPPTAAPGDAALEALVLRALQPVLKAWLDAHLPEIVAQVAREEIHRLTGRGS